MKHKCSLFKNRRKGTWVVACQECLFVHDVKTWRSGYTLIVLHQGIMSLSVIRVSR